MPIATELSIAPLGAGDLIDRAVRLYRRHLFVLLRIAAPPVFVSAVGSVLWAISWRGFMATPSTAELLVYILLTIISVVLVTGGRIFSLIVMGGASRNLVTHLLWNEPVSVRTTYAAVRSRFWSLLGASLIMMIWISASMSVGFVGWYMVIIFVTFGAVFLGQWAPIWVAAIVGIVGFLGATTLALWLFFFMAGRIVYVPQAMLVEGKRVFESVSRSFSLAKGNVRRLMAMSLFVFFTTYSALMILVIPLGWYGYISGVDPSPFGVGEWPAWYAISYSIIEPLSQILLTPVWMLGLSLLYVDERVRHEGYDIELMASQNLPEMPQLDFSSPLAPAISAGPAAFRPPLRPPPSSPGSVLGLS
jgi:hypothetical protein